MASREFADTRRFLDAQATGGISGAPLGKGEIAHPPEGNAMLYTVRQGMGPVAPVAFTTPSNNDRLNNGYVPKLTPEQKAIIEDYYGSVAVLNSSITSMSTYTDSQTGLASSQEQGGTSEPVLVGVKTPLWINQFQTGIDIQIDSAQLRTKLSHRPVRFAERSLQFTTLWNVANRDKYLQLGADIRAHWAANLNEGRPTPMYLVYYGANKTFQGFIDNWETAFANTDVLLSYTFNMRILMTEIKRYPHPEAALHGVNSPFTPRPEGIAPQPYEARDWGEGWYNKTDWPAQIKAQAAKFKKADPVV